MAGGHELTYRVGALTTFPYLSVKQGGKWFFIGEFPRITIEEIALAVRDIEHGDASFWQKLPHGSDTLAARVYEVLIHMSEGDRLDLGIDDKVLAAIGQYTDTPHDLHEEELAETASYYVAKCVADPAIVERLDRKFWTRDVSIDEGKLLLPVPPKNQDKYMLWMFDGILRASRGRHRS